MKYFIATVLFILLSIVCKSQNPEQKIKAVLDSQVACWNRGDIDGFMNGYWNNDSMKFISKNGIRYGWQKTLEAYKKGYPDKAAMGQLKFGILNISCLSKNIYQVVGTWEVNSTKGELKGVFSLLFKKINGNWLIIVDHTS